MEVDERLIRSKLRLPFIRASLVNRPHLHQKIKEGIRGPLTLVTAPAGFGKTTLVATSISGCGVPFAWLSLDREDNQAGRFLNHFIASIHLADARIGSDAAQLADGLPQAQPEMVLTSLINDLEREQTDLVLVLDDYQLVTNQVVHGFVTFILEHCPRFLHLVIASRSDPPLPLSRLRARGQTVELRAADMRFSEQEAQQFINEVMDLHLHQEAISLLEKRTEGWVAGLQMAALSMRGRKDVDQFIREFAGTNRFIMDFMLEEVLASESQEVQSFLLQTSILNRMTGSLCDAVTGTPGGQSMLEYLERSNVFILPLDDERRWYRYHHLFADLLQSRLIREGLRQAAELRIRASDWCERHGYITDAVDYAFASQRYECARNLIERYWGVVASDGEIETVWSWLAALPPELIHNSAPLSVACCWVSWLQGKMDAIEMHLLDAERILNVSDILAERDSDVANPELATMVATLRSIISRYHADYESACTFAEQALSLLPENIPLMEDARLRSLIQLALASAYDGAGDLDRSAQAYAETIRLSRVSQSATGIGITIRLVGALRLLGRLRAAESACQGALDFLQANQMERLPAAGVVHVAMSEVLVEQNRLDAAEEHLARGIELGKWSGRLEATRNAANALSRLRQARQDFTGALAAIRETETALGSTPPPLARAELLALEARVLARMGALQEADRRIEEAIHLASRDQGQTHGMVSLAAMRVLLAQGSSPEVIAKLTDAILDMENRGWLGAVIELRLLRGMALAGIGDFQAAQGDIERALILGEPQGYARIFLDEGEPARDLITQWLAQAGVDPAATYATALLSQFPAEITAAERTAASVPRINLVEPLSRRELEVLQLIAQGKTNLEIARELVVAAGTIKAHAASIFRKLEAANRTEAVARARQLGILA